MAKKKGYNTGGIVYSTADNFTLAGGEEEMISRPPKDQSPMVRLDKKHRGGKTVTLIESLQLNPSDLEDISRQLKTLCGSGGSAKNGEVIIQGDHRDKVLQWLKTQGYAKAKKS